MPSRDYNVLAAVIAFVFGFIFLAVLLVVWPDLTSFRSFQAWGQSALFVAIPAVPFFLFLWLAWPRRRSPKL